MDLRRLPLVLAAVLLALLPAAPTAAAQPAEPEGQVTFGVRTATESAPDNRGRFSYGATPGAVVKDFIAVSNIGLSPLTLRVYASDAFNTPEGGFDLLAAGRKPTDVGAWVVPGAENLTVEGRSFAIVPFTLTIPPTATPGDHVGGIVASLVTERTDAQGNKVSVDQRVGARIYLRVAGDLRPQLSVEGLSGSYRQSWNPVGHGSATVTYTVRNTGNIRLQGTQRVAVRASWGSTVDASPLPDLPELLPGNAIQVTAQVPSVLPAGWLTAEVHLDPATPPGASAVPLSGVDASATFAAVPWAPLAVLLLLAGLVVFLVWRRRRRRGVVTAEPDPQPSTADIEEDEEEVADAKVS